MMLSEVYPGIHAPVIGDESEKSFHLEPFCPTIGSLCNVTSRTWAGINKPGGIGRVLQVYYDADGKIPTHVDVKYIVNHGRENRVEMVFVEPYHLEDNAVEATRTSRRGGAVSSEMKESRNDGNSELQAEKMIADTKRNLSTKKRCTETCTTLPRSPKRKTDLVEEGTSIHHAPPPPLIQTCDCSGYTE